MKKDLVIGLVIFMVVLGAYILASPGPSDYDYFSRLAKALAEGRLYLSENPPWLNELIPWGGKYYVVYPPMPAVLMVPLAYFFKGSGLQTWFSISLGAVNGWLVWVMLRRLKMSRLSAGLVAIFFSLGTNHLFLASVGSAWYLAHVVAVFFLLLALIEAFGKQRLWLIGLLVGASFWARTPVIFGASFFIIYLWRKFWPINWTNFFQLACLGMGLVVFGLIDGWYNLARFGQFSPLSPYQLIPGLDRDSVFRNGLMSWRFVPRHLEAIYLRLPVIISKPPFVIPSAYSLAIWLTSPALLAVVRAKRSLLSLACWVAIVVTFGVISLWAGVGYWQFGYRFAQDFMPFLLILVAMGFGDKPKAWAYILVVLSILVNVWGVVMINHLGIWSW